MIDPRIGVALVIALALASLAAWALWERSGRLECEVARVEVTAAYNVLADKVKEQNSAVQVLASKGAQAREAGRQALIVAQATETSMAGEIASLRARIAASAPAGQDCRDAWREIRAAVGK